jgi:hypothetical protein
MVPVMCPKVKIHCVLDAQQGFCEGNPLARQRVHMRRHQNWNNHMPKCFNLITTPLRHPDLWLMKLYEAWIWRHHRPELVKFIDPGVLFEEGHYPVHPMLNHTKIHVVKYIRYDNSHQREAFHIP